MTRGTARYELGDKQGAVADLMRAAILFRQQGDTKSYLMVLSIMRKLFKTPLK
jgi:hypothetical protein